MVDEAGNYSRAFEAVLAARDAWLTEVSQKGEGEGVFFCVFFVLLCGVFVRCREGAGGVESGLHVTVDRSGGGDGVVNRECYVPAMRHGRFCSGCKRAC